MQIITKPANAIKVGAKCGEGREQVRAEREASVASPSIVWLSWRR